MTSRPQTHLTAGLDTLWRSKAHTDITIHVEDKDFPCHKAVLTAASLYEPAHEIMALGVLRKLILQTRMRSHPVGLDV